MCPAQSGRTVAEMVGLPYAARQALQNLDRTIGEKPRGRSLAARGERGKTNLTGITAYWDTQKGRPKDYKSLRRARFEGLTIGLE
jgi:hypothetical protein